MNYTPEGITQEEMLRELIRQEIGEYSQATSGAISQSGDELYRQQSYIQLLIEVSSKTTHKVTKELEEALLKLKEITYV